MKKRMYLQLRTFFRGSFCPEKIGEGKFKRPDRCRSYVKPLEIRALRYLMLLLFALVCFSSLFTIPSCKEEPDKQYDFEDTTCIHCDNMEIIMALTDEPAIISGISTPSVDFHNFYTLMLKRQIHGLFDQIIIPCSELPDECKKYDSEVIISGNVTNCFFSIQSVNFDENEHTYPFTYRYNYIELKSIRIKQK